MAEPTLTEVFGAGAIQDATTLTITKADLVSVGLTASASNTAESLLAAIVLKARDFLTDTAFTSNPDQSITILSGFDSIVQRDNGGGTFSTVRQAQLNVNLHQPDTFVIDPDNF
ncbi:MAG: hypothetical protein HLUCCA11_13950 [Phormidesmis priestleyi Ana]|uniref:Uncharacterized protein n=1 Tax=Phormidesmis priestleyi Ana TaxID=1666911 RepID=A0A0P7YVX6_9CYAN|nr:MAG: hypothetical protein HLUCCA11_13950 [Phormidesmis priestleyi Ana]